jgi:hypothetical protein
MDAPIPTSLMRVQYSPAFVEAVVTLAIYGDRRLEALLHRAIDPLYRLEPGRDRDRRFASAYWEFFLDLGHHARLSLLLEERELMVRQIARCLVHESPGSRGEGAELLVRHDGDLDPIASRTLTLQVRPESFLDELRFASWARRELLHIEDMVDPAFGYAPWLREDAPAQDNLVRDRYRVLWDAWIEARLNRSGFGDEVCEQRLRRLMGRAFSCPEPLAVDAALTRVLNAAALTHAQLLAWARNPEQLLGARNVDTAPAGPDPGDPCPLCAFSTFDWYDFSGAKGERAAEAIRDARADWSPDAGACRQCAELYLYAAAPRP